MTDTGVTAALAAKAKVQDALAKLNASISRKQQQANALDVEIQRLYSLPLCFDDFAIYLKQWIEKLGDSHLKSRQKRIAGAGHLGWSGDQPEAVPWSNYEGGNFPLRGYRNPGSWDQTNDIFVAFCFFFPEQVYARLLEVYREHNANCWGNEDLPRVAEREVSIQSMRAQQTALMEEVQALQDQLAALSL